MQWCNFNNGVRILEKNTKMFKQLDLFHSFSYSTYFKITELGSKLVGSCHGSTETVGDGKHLGTVWN